MFKNVNSQLPTDRKFGIFFAALFMLLSIYAYSKEFGELLIASFTMGFLFAVVAILVPKVLRPLNYLWYRLGLILGRIVSPILLGIIFMLMITPIALMMRILGRDELKIKKRDVGSYWVNRTPSSLSPDSFENQF